MNYLLAFINKSVIYRTIICRDLFAILLYNKTDGSFMNKFKFSIINSSTLLLDVFISENCFGLYHISHNTYKLGFKENPLFVIEIAISEERIIIEPVDTRQYLHNESIELPGNIQDWFSGTYCTDYSIINHLPSGKYRLLKTARKPVFNREILLGNEWQKSPANILCFEGSGSNEIITSPEMIKNKIFPVLYSMIIGADNTSAPSLNSPLLAVLIDNYEIIHDNTAGLIFFTFNNDEPLNPQNIHKEELVLIIPCENKFLINPFDNKSIPSGYIDRIINAFNVMV